MLDLLPQVVSLADPVGPAHKSVVDRPSDTGVMEGPTVEVSVSVGRLPVDLLSEGAIWLLDTSTSRNGMLPSFS